MTMSKIFRAALPLTLALVLGACGGGDPGAGADPHGEADEGEHRDEGKLVLTAQQIAAAGIQTARPTIGGSATIDLPATIEGDPQAMHVISAAIGGRIVALTRNLGETVRRGEVVAAIESREAASLKAEIEAARARLGLANSNLAREQRLFAERVSPEQDLIAARTVAAEARIALRRAEQQIAAAGASGGGMNRIGITAPAAGQVISRHVVLGQTVAADAELYRIANLATVSLTLSLQPADAGRVRPGTRVAVTAAGRQGTARIAFVSPALDPETRLVPAIASLDNRAGHWRVGEAVTVAVPLAGSGGDDAIRVPIKAVQTVAGRPVIFVRTGDGFQAVPVTLGGSAGESAIIRAGLTGQEEIATVNSFTLKAELGKGEAEHSH
ncbi:MAG TPA: efflux RND transporter periplasmic adaptor subunit [Sphingobium sp.]|nr:efflux RND transporter periplasmic adaptor subunit [Sphingobium sp.]